MTKKNVLPKPVRAWIKALRSGKYKQGRYALRDANDKYCCLGVACDLAVKAGVIKKPTLNDDESYYFSKGNYMQLPNKVRKWLGIHNKNGSCWIDDQYHSLISKNDTQKWSFKKIADFIEKNWERLAAKPSRRS